MVIPLERMMVCQMDSTSGYKVCKKYTPVLSLLSGFLSLSSGGKYKKAFVEFKQSKENVNPNF